MQPLRSVVVRLLTVQVVSLLSAGQVSGQDVAKPIVDCARCRIERQIVVTLPTVWPDGGFSEMPFSVARFATDNWIAVDQVAGLVHRFDSKGTYIGPLARRGSGPGELRGPMLAFGGPADSTFVIDPGAGRMSVFDSRGRFARSSPWTGVSPVRVMIQSGHSFIAPNSYATRSSFGFPLHEFNFEGKLLKSFGARENETVRSARDLPHLRVPTRADGDGSYWTIEARAPRLARWSHAGELLEQWTLPVPGFVPLAGMQPDSPRGFEFVTLEQGADGVLWLMMSVSMPEARDAFGVTKIVDGLPHAAVEDYGKYFDTRIIAVDPKKRSVLAFRDVPELVVSALGGGYFWGIGPGGDMGVLHVLRVSVRR